MAINRSFTANCDYCDGEFAGESAFSMDLKTAMSEQGWKCANRISCPRCNAISSHEIAKAFRTSTPAEKEEVRKWVQQQLAKETM